MVSNGLAPVPKLRLGDTIAVVAPSGPVPCDRLQAGIARLERWFRVEVSEDICRSEKFLAGSDLRRAEEFNRALRNPDIRAIWAARGGYGASRIVNDLDGDAFACDPKPIVGFSDITVLLCWAASLGFRSLHAPVLTQLGEAAEADVQWAMEMLLGKSDGRCLAETIVGDCSDAEGPLIGGNLSILAHLCGTQLQAPLAGAICILEDVGERPYALDRYLTQLLLQTKQGLGAARAVLLGDFTRCTEALEPAACPVSGLLGRLQDKKISCGAGVPVGHGLQNRAFPFGGNAVLTGGVLEIVDSVVSS